MIVPSLPGFGYSTPTQPDMNFWKIADVWHELMTQTLGHTRYAAAGCDVDALVTGQLGHKYADELHGIHIGSALKLDLFTGDRAWDFSGGRPIPPELPTSNAPLTPEGRRRLAALVVDDGWTLRRAAERFQCSPSTAFRWTQRYRAGEPLADRSSRSVVHHREPSSAQNDASWLCATPETAAAFWADTSSNRTSPETGCRLARQVVPHPASATSHISVRSAA